MNVRAFFTAFAVGLFVLFTGHGIAFAPPPLVVESPEVVEPVPAGLLR